MFGRFNKIHRTAVANAAKSLAAQIDAHRSDETLQSTFSLLAPIIRDALDGALRTPPRFIPGNNAYFELFDPYPDLHKAYSVFCLVAGVSDYSLVRDYAKRHNLVD